MIRKPISRKAELFYMAISIAFLISFYSFLSYRQHARNVKDTTIPNLYQFIEGGKKLLGADSAGDYWLIEDATATGIRLASGLAVGIGLSFFIGLGMGVHPPIEALFKLPITFLGKIPATAMLAVYFVLFGTDLEMYTAMIALGILPALAFSIYGAARADVSDHAIDKAYTLGASSFEVIWEVVVQQILPRIIENIRLCIGPAMVFLIAAEWNTADVGFGYRLRIQSRLLNMNVVYTYLLLLGFFGFFVDWALISLRKKLCPWFDLRN
jgi:NitT/TauT family transport system permease protein